MKFTPDNITQLEPHQIFVFGSNLAGRHGKGAALVAAKKFGAIRGQGCGLMGQSYGIPTKDHELCALMLMDIARHVGDFIGFARENPKMEFLVTKIGCGLAGYSESHMRHVFCKFKIPKNVILPLAFQYVAYPGRSRPPQTDSPRSG